jgi:hypothetical protein
LVGLRGRGKVAADLGEAGWLFSMVAPPALTAESHASAWKSWLGPPVPSVERRCTRLAEGPSLPISFATRKDGKEVGDLVMELTLTLLACYCREGVALGQPLSLDTLLESRDILKWWDPLKCNRVVLQPVLQHHHWFLLRRPQAFEYATFITLRVAMRERVPCSPSALST